MVRPGALQPRHVAAVDLARAARSGGPPGIAAVAAPVPVRPGSVRPREAEGERGGQRDGERRAASVMAGRRMSGSIISVPAAPQRLDLADPAGTCRTLRGWRGARPGSSPRRAGRSARTPTGPCSTRSPRAGRRRASRSAPSRSDGAGCGATPPGRESTVTCGRSGRDEGEPLRVEAAGASAAGAGTRRARGAGWRSCHRSSSGKWDRPCTSGGVKRNSVE